MAFDIAFRNTDDNAFINTDDINWYGLTVSVDYDASIIRYYCIITGANDSESDLTVPISSFSARRRNGDPSYLQVVIPSLDDIDNIIDRGNGTIKIRMAFEVEGEQVYIETLIETDSIESIRYDEGSTNKTITLVGYVTESFDGKSVDVSGATYKSVDDGVYRYRFARPTIGLDPGDTVTVTDDSDTEFGVNTISYSVSAASCQIELESV